MSAKGSSSTKLKDSIKDILSREENINVISNQALQLLIESQNKHFEKYMKEMKTFNKEIITSLNNGFSILSESITDSADTMHGDNVALCKAINNLTETMSKQHAHQNLATVEKSQFGKLYDKEILDRSDKFYQVFRSQELSSYYRTLVTDKENPYIPQKFRPKVNENTPDYEIKVKESHAIQNVLRECDLLDARISQFIAQIAEIDKKVMEKIDKCEQTEQMKEVLKNRYKETSKHKEQNKKQAWFRNFNKMKEEHEKEINSGKRFITKIIRPDETTSSNIQQRRRNHSNYRGQYQYPRNNRTRYNLRQ